MRSRASTSPVENEFVKPTEKQLLQEIVRGAQLAFENAEKLYQEAQLLGSSGAFARALTLHQISMEECSKVDMLGTAAISLVLGHPVDINKLAARSGDTKSRTTTTLT